MNEIQLQTQGHRFSSSEWMTVPGKNCDPLDPPGDGVVKTLPKSCEPVFPGGLLPTINEVRAVNAAYLEVSSILKSTKWIAVIPGLIGFPIIMLTLIGGGIYLSSMGITRGWAVGYSIPLLMMNLILVLILVVMAYSVFTVAAFSPNDEPVRFALRDKKIHRYQARKWRLLDMDFYHPVGRANVEIYDWENCRAEVTRKRIYNGRTSYHVSFLELAIIDPETRSVIKRFRVGDQEVLSDFSSRVFLWEVIRRYMEEGPQDIPFPPVQSHRGTLFDCIDECNPFSFMAGAEGDINKFFSFICAVVVWILLLPSLLVILSKWISLKLSRKIHWNGLEHTVFRIPEEAISQQQALQRERQAALMRSEELKRRRNANRLWIGSLILQITIAWWYLSIPGYYQ